MPIFDAIRKSLSNIIHPASYTSLILPRTGFNYASEVNGWQSSIIMACVGWIQRTYPEAPQVIQQRNQDNEWQEIDHPLTVLMNKPNPYYDGLLLQGAFIADLVISGNAYLLKVRSNAGRLVELWWCPSSMIAPKWPDTGDVFISHYDYMPGGQAIALDVRDVAHYRLGIDPTNLRKGRSPLQSLVREVFTDDEAANMTASLLKNLGVPGLVISPDKDTVSPQDADAVKAYVKSRTTGDRRGEPIILGAATKVETFGFNPQQMDLRQLRKIPEERISAVLGVPAIVAGLGAGLDRSTYSNMAEARDMAYESGIIPLQRLVASQTKHSLLSEYTDDLTNYRVAYDLSEIRVLREDEDKLSARIIAQVTGGICKVRDAQRILSLPIDETQDFYLRAFSAMPVRSGESGGPEEADTTTDEKAAPLFGWTERQRKARGESIAKEKDEWIEIVQKKIAVLYEQEEEAVIEALGSDDPVKAAGDAVKNREGEWVKALEQISENIIEHFGKQPTKLFSAFLGRVRRWIRANVAEETRQIMASNSEDIQAFIGEHIAEAYGTYDNIQDVRSFYSDTIGWKSKRIATTEVTRSSGYARNESAKDAGKRKRVWVTMGDALVRDLHSAINGQSRPFGERYSNGLMFPGDPDGPLEEWLNCRCWEEFI